MSWHLDETVVAVYRAGELDEARAASVEAHVIACESCRALIAATADRARHDAVWTEVRDAADRPSPRVFERVLLWFGVSQHVARLLAATPSLTGSWLIAVCISLGWGLAAANEGQRGVVAFLAFAPLIPLAGVAFAFGPRVDPSYEVTVASPMRGARLLLLRATTVFATSTLLTAAASLALPGMGWKAAAWLLPALGVTTSALALSTWIEPRAAAAVVGVCWMYAVVLTAAARGGSVLDRFAIFEPRGQAILAVVSVCSALLVAARLDTFDAGRQS